MKKIAILFFSVFTAVSCLEKGTFSQTYTAYLTFEQTEEVYNKSFKDSVFVMSSSAAFAYSNHPILFSQSSDNGAFKGGFLISILKGEKNGAMEKAQMANDAYRVNSESGTLGSKAYVVFYDNPDASVMPVHDIDFMYKASGTFTPSACYVNNTKLVARKVKENFQPGDKLLLKAIGVKSDGSTVETAIKLADYTESRDSVMYSWTEFPLSSLGAVDYIDFKVESTNPNVPGYFCLDNFVAGVQVGY